MMTILRSVFGFVVSKPRLVIEYILIGAVVALCGLMTYMWYDSGVKDRRLEDAEGQINTLHSDNGKLHQAVSYLVDQREKDVKHFNDLVTGLKGVTDKDETLRENLQILEVKNATVKVYLDTLIPSELSGMLNESPASGAPSP